MVYERSKSARLILGRGRVTAEAAISMGLKVGINGFGRIGRNIMRAALGDQELDFVAVNDLTDTKTLAHLLKYDSILGNLDAGRHGARRRHHRRRRRVQGAVGQGSRRSCRGRSSASTSCSSRPASSPIATARPSTWRRAPRRSSSPRRPRSRTSRVVMGVNDGQVRPGEAPHHLERVVHDELPRAGRQGAARDTSASSSGWMTTIHSYTNDQKLLDLPHKDLRRARAAALSIIPTTTGAATARRRGAAGAEGQARRHRDARADAERVGAWTWSCSSSKKTTAEEVNAAFKAAADGTAEGHPGSRGRAARVDRLPRQRATRRSSMPPTPRSWTATS